MKSKSICFYLFFCVCITTYAQSYLSKATFEVPRKLITPKGKTANVRTAPSLKAPIDSYDDGFYSMTVQLNSQMLYNVLEDLDGWYKVDVYIPFYDAFFEDGSAHNIGYVSKTVVRESPCLPFSEYVTDNSFLSFDRHIILNNKQHLYWSPTATKDYFVAVNKNFDNTGWSIWLGKRLGNVIVFKYNTACSFIYDDNVRKVTIDTQYSLSIKYNGDLSSVLPYDYMEDYDDNMFQFNSFDESALEMLFKKRIEEEQENQYENFPVFYVNDEWLNKYN